MDYVNESDIDIFYKPSRIVISGVSGAGKSSLCVNLIHKYHKKFKKIVVLGSSLENVSQIPNITRDDNFDPLSNPDELTGDNILLVFDDVMFDPELIKRASVYFIRGRPQNISSVFICHNLFMANTYFRTISLNASHIFILRMRDARQIQFFSKSFLCDSQIDPFLKLYRREVLLKKYGYMLIDFNAGFESPIQIRNSLFSEKTYERAFVL